MLPCNIRKSVTPVNNFRKLAGKPWVHQQWSQVLGKHCLSFMPQSSTHQDIRRDNIAAALALHAPIDVAEQYGPKCIAPPFSSSDTSLNQLGFQANMASELTQHLIGQHHLVDRRCSFCHAGAAEYQLSACSNRRCTAWPLWQGQIQEGKESLPDLMRVASMTSMRFGIPI